MRPATPRPATGAGAGSPISGRPGRRLHRPTPPPLLPRVPWRRVLRWARRSPVVWWSAAAVVAAVAATQAGALDDRARAARAAWGEGVPVVVARRPLAPGDVLGPADVVVESWPPAVVPDGALDAVPEGRTVAAPIVAGEAVVAARLAPEGLSDVAALLPPGWRAVAVPAGDGFGGDLPPLAVGDRVDVLASFDPFDLEAAALLEPDAPAPSGVGDTDPGAASGRMAGVVAAGALVVDVGDGSVTVAVPAAVAPHVADAATRGTITLALVGAT